MYRKLEACYDQMIHPQKRLDIRPALELLVIRILEIKEKLIEHNRRPHSTLVHLDDVLMDLKLDPRVLEIPVPRWLRDNMEPDEHLKLLNLEEKSEETKEKKTKKTATDSKKATKAAEEPKVPQTLAEKNAWYDKIIEENKIQEEEEVTEPFAYEMDIVMAIRLIQKNERGRQWRRRLLQIISIRRRALKDAETKRRIREGLETSSVTEKDNKATLLIQKRLKGLIARAKIEKMRQEELQFLGMMEKTMTKEEKLNATPLKIKAIEDKRKKEQEDAYADFKNAITRIKDAKKLNEEFDIRDKMYDERMMWIIDYRRDHGGKLPKSAAEFYKRADVAKPKTEEELAAEEAAKKAKKGKKDTKAKKTTKKKGDKKEVKKEYLWTGPTTDAVIQLQNATDKYSQVWEKKDETSEDFTKYDKEMIKEQVTPLIDHEIELEVDKLIEAELANLELQEGKKKKKKKPKKKKKKKAKAKKLPAALKLISKKSTYELLNELFVLGVAKKFSKPFRVSEFLGDYNYIGSIEDMSKHVNDTSLAQIRSMVTEWGILPLGSKSIHETITRNYGSIKSMLFMGPQGSGKTMMAKAMASETYSLFLDVSPAIIENIYTEKKGEDKLVATVMRVAKELQPAVIYIDECEMVFPAKKKAKKKKGAKKGKGASRIKSQLSKLKKSYLKKEDRVLIVGCTNTVDEMSVTDAQKFFDVHINFPYPDSLNRKKLWGTFIVENGGAMRLSFPISTLGHITEGYTTGSIKLACEKVLTEQRIVALKNRPLLLSEFIGPLSATYTTSAGEYQAFKTFYDKVTGEFKRREAEAKAKGQATDDKKKKAKKGK
eukprot:TRINITY_DN704_c0_g2_i7.p1 TRINITY_DN704_c0_g2~~TRINITY_DN704_c0_g2_i7.p1  ORF type:complete len:828 (-),score=357.22 TRINITY_DN704_c0_g2_i7:684-3167(-)